MNDERNVLTLCARQKPARYSVKGAKYVKIQEGKNKLPQI